MDNQNTTSNNQQTGMSSGATPAWPSQPPSMPPASFTTPTPTPPMQQAAPSSPYSASTSDAQPLPQVEPQSPFTTNSGAQTSSVPPTTPYSVSGVSPAQPAPAMGGAVPPANGITMNNVQGGNGGSNKLVFVIAGVLLLLAVAGGYYLYTLYQVPTVTEQPVMPTVVPATPVPTMTEEEKAAMEIEKLEATSSSDEIPALEQDVNGTSLSTLDQELPAIEQQL